jgi:hypothetical protein
MKRRCGRNYFLFCFADDVFGVARAAGRLVRAEDGAFRAGRAACRPLRTTGADARRVRGSWVVFAPDARSTSVKRV